FPRISVIYRDNIDPLLVHRTNPQHFCLLQDFHKPFFFLYLSFCKPHFSHKIYSLSMCILLPPSPALKCFTFSLTCFRAFISSTSLITPSLRFRSRICSRASITFSRYFSSRVPNPSSRKNSSIGAAPFIWIWEERARARAREAMKVSPPY